MEKNNLKNDYTSSKYNPSIKNKSNTKSPTGSQGAPISTTYR